MKALYKLLSQVLYILFFNQHALSGSEKSPSLRISNIFLSMWWVLFNLINIVLGQWKYV